MKPARSRNRSDIPGAFSGNFRLLQQRLEILNELLQLGQVIGVFGCVDRLAKYVQAFEDAHLSHIKNVG